MNRIDEVITHVEAHVRVLECVETTFVGRQLFGIEALRAKEIADGDEGDAYACGNDQKQQGRQIFGQHLCLLSALGCVDGMMME